MVRRGSDRHHQAAAGETRGEQRISRPSFRRPDTTGRNRKDRPRRVMVPQQRIHLGALDVSGIQSRARYVVVAAAAPSQTEQAFGVMIVVYIRKTLGVERSPGRRRKADSRLDS